MEEITPNRLIKEVREQLDNDTGGERRLAEACGVYSRTLDAILADGRVDAEEARWLRDGATQIERAADASYRRNLGMAGLLCRWAGLTRRMQRRTPKTQAIPFPVLDVPEAA